MGPELFKKVAMVAKLKKRQFRQGSAHMIDGSLSWMADCTLMLTFTIKQLLHLYMLRWIRTMTYYCLKECVDIWELLTIILVSKVRQLNKLSRYIHQPGVYKLA